MREVVTFAAEARARAGKGTARAARQSGRVPAVIYGGETAPESISIDTKALLKELHKGGFLNRLLEIEVGGQKTRVLPRDVQFHPVSDMPIHADFMRVTAGSRIRIWIPVHFEGADQSRGVKLGGVLNIVRHEIEFFCAPDNIPDAITVNLAATEIGDSIHISQIALPEGVKPVINRDFTVATLAPPSGEAEAAKPEAAAAPAKGGKAAPAKAAAAAPAKAAAAPKKK
ncbi:MAG: 50S ribosomal protein L25/general stress protein Ctc [Alphaproteobacteria bacterium]|jgi:large subunit ribosomal protein L25|nr:50S ribosomal protein L25/general stress protein Ctc [Alphaproteobacteria bacterium]